ncbi:MAG: hypothetical protein AB1941_09870 [Gemmatimonadota bacterium]
MPFLYNQVGSVVYGGTTYWMVECGGGGDCQFLSAAWLLDHYQVPGHPYDAADLRTRASAGLVGWVDHNQPMPVTWKLEGQDENILLHQPSSQEAADFGNQGEYGELPCIAAMTAWLYSQGRDVEMHVLDGTRGEVHVLRSSLAQVNSQPAYRIHLWFEGDIHYQALVPDARIATVPLDRQVALYADIFSNGAPVQKGKLTASLQSSSQGAKTTTLSIPAGTALEIHAIDCEQGDATLVMLRDQNGVIRFSLLIDAGEKHGQVTGYFDTLIKEGNFRPLDMFVATHPDKDHIADSKNVLDNPRYTSDGVLLYDNGLPPLRDKEYNDVYLKNRHAARRRRPTLDKPILNGFMGLTIHCLACNGLMKNGYEPEAGRPWHHLERQTIGENEFNPDGELQVVEAMYPTDKNDYSIALLLAFGQFSYFTAGDLSGTFEEDVAHHVNFFFGPVSAWKAGHHGAQGSSGPAALGYLQGRFCVLSYGTDNGHGHPHQATIDQLESLNGVGEPCTYYGTGSTKGISAGKRRVGTLGAHGRDDLGTIRIRVLEAVASVREEFEVWTERNNPTHQNGGWQTFTCQKKKPRLRNTTAPVVASGSLGKASRTLTDQQRQDKLKRRNERHADAVQQARTLLLDAIRRKQGGSLDLFNLALAWNGNRDLYESSVARLAAQDLEDRYIDRDVQKMAADLLKRMGL